ncbi:hypothetical protein [Labedaea rhizosphaerae]|uniref:Uncharacterized protein n=1 Tax=Labedaea rhizosphaerae TaxID=598644 RepID=A0A4R6SEF6_LABRH|nr:hypothetical protein [Labedaea rhizosphaerae]TDP97426.1 hypothetical protein EV186_103390 [Labedaea rhizosphaerae]
MQGSDRREPAQRAAKLHVAALLEREGHPLRTEVADNGGGIGRGKIVGIAAGTMLVAGAVAASALGLSGQAQTHNEAGGQPVPGAAGHGAAGGVTEYPAQQVSNQLPSGGQNQAAPQTTTPQSAPVTQARPAPAAQHRVAPQTTHHSTSSSTHTQTQAPQQQQPQQQQQQPAAQQSQPEQQQTQGGLGQTLQDVVTPVTNTLDDTLQPALSMIPVVGGLLGG